MAHEEIAEGSGRRQIVHLTAEYWPYIRTGGLGEAVRGIATQQARLGHEAFAFLPLYAPIRESGCDLSPLGSSFQVQVGHRTEEGRLWEAPGCADGVRVLLVEHSEYFQRSGVYGDEGRDYPDNHRRFAFFSAAVLRALPTLVRHPVVLHMHDWHTAFAVIFLRVLMKGDPFAEGIASVLSVHNGGYQGHFPPETLPDIGLPMDLYHMDFLEWYGRANILKAGLKSTDMATTVSAGHAFELRTEAGGFGLHHTFLGLRDQLVGITNGIDYTIWNPLTDTAIPANYSSNDLEGKRVCKAALQEEYGLEVNPDRLLIGMVARMVAQKGLELVVDGGAVKRSDAQFIFLGAGEPRFTSALQELARAHPDGIAADPAFTEAGEHRVMAGADALLMPSLYEPCGLTQMRAQRYGTVPLARRVGGLEETIEDGVTGLLFDDFIPERLDWLIDRAVAWYRRPVAWSGLMREGMARDFSWEQVVTRYFAVYDRALQIRAQAQASGPHRS
jgi:starch synthase